MTRRPRAHQRQVHLYNYAEAAADMGRLSELARAGGETRARLLAEFEILQREVLTLGGGGVPRRLMAWEAISNELQREAGLAATERGVVLDQEAEDLEEFTWELDEIEAAIESRDDLTLAHRDDESIVYATDEGEQVAWVRHPRHPRWRWATEDLTGGAGFTRQEQTNEPGAPLVSIRLLPALDDEHVERLEVAVDDPPSPEVQDLLDGIADAGRILREERWKDGADSDAIEAHVERLVALFDQAGQEPDALRKVEFEARATALELVAARQKREHAAGGGEEDESPPAPPPAAPDPDAPVAPAETPGAPEHAGPPASGSVGEDEAAPSPPPTQDPAEASLATEALEDEREQLQNYAAEIQEVGARDRAFQAIAAAQTLPEIELLRGRVTASLQSEARVRAQLEEHAAAARAKHEQANAEKAEQEKPKESALSRKRKELRAADQATKDQPATRELRRRVLELIQEVWPEPGTAPRSLISEVEESGFQALTVHEKQLTKQAEARASKPPAPIARGESVPPVEGWA